MIPLTIPFYTIPSGATAHLCHLALAFDDVTNHHVNNGSLASTDLFHLWGHYVANSPDRKSCFQTAISITPSLRKEHHPRLDHVPDFILSRSIYISLQTTLGRSPYLGDTLRYWICQDQRAAPGTTLHNFHVAFSLITRSLSILPSVYLSDISAINLNTIFLLFFAPNLRRLYANDPSTNISSNSINSITKYISASIGTNPAPPSTDQITLFARSEPPDSDNDSIFSTH